MSHQINEKGFSTLLIVMTVCIFIIIFLVAWHIINSASHAKPDPHSMAIVALRNMEATSFNNYFNVISMDTDLTNYAHGSDDFCDQGFSNEGPPPYHNQCTLKVTHFYGFAGDFLTVLTNLQSVLSKCGWPVNNSYSYYSDSVSSAVSEGGNGGMAPYFMNNNYKTGPSIALEYSSIDMRITNETVALLEDSNSFYEKVNNVNLSQISSQLTKARDKYLLQISIEGNYYTN